MSTVPDVHADVRGGLLTAGVGRSPHWSGWLALLGLCVLLAACPAGSARAAQPGHTHLATVLLSQAGPAVPSSLTGESLAASTPHQPPSACPSGAGIIRYLVRGEASGPYPGTFVESGSYEIDNSALVNFRATLKIVSSTTTIYGVVGYIFGGASCGMVSTTAPYQAWVVVAGHTVCVASTTTLFMQSGIPGAPTVFTQTL